MQRLQTLSACRACMEGHGMSDGGKGYAQRPRSIADDEWAYRWDAIFGRDRMTDITETSKREREADKLNQTSELNNDQMAKPDTA